MLDEFKEFTAFTQSPTSDNPRLQPMLLTHSFSMNYKLDGIDQVLTIIARHFIFSEYGSNLKDIAGATIQVIKKWIGMPYDDEEYPQVTEWFRTYNVTSGWLEQYWKYQFRIYCNKTSESKKKLKANKDRNPDKEWEACLAMRFESFFKPYDYDANTLTFNNVVANAMSLGPLKTQYCVVKKSEDSSDRKKESKQKNKSDLFKKMNMFKYLINCKGKQATTDLKVLKNIIAFLILQQEHPKEQNEVILQKTRLFGWYGLDCSDGKAKHWCFEQYRFRENAEGEEHPIMYRVPFADYTKLGIDSRYLKMHDFKLINPDEENNYAENYWILEDAGHGAEVPLKVRNKI